MEAINATATDLAQPLKKQAKIDKPDAGNEIEFEPIKGYPMLHWRGKRPFRATQYFPAQLSEKRSQVNI